MCHNSCGLHEFCAAPNECECNEGYYGYPECQPLCPDGACNHGWCDQPGKCKCISGYELTATGTQCVAVCEPGFQRDYDKDMFATSECRRALVNATTVEEDTRTTAMIDEVGETTLTTADMMSAETWTTSENQESTTVDSTSYQLLTRRAPCVPLCEPFGAGTRAYCVQCDRTTIECEFFGDRGRIIVAKVTAHQLIAQPPDVCQCSTGDSSTTIAPDRTERTDDGISTTEQTNEPTTHGTETLGADAGSSTERSDIGAGGCAGVPIYGLHVNCTIAGCAPLAVCEPDSGVCKCAAGYEWASIDSGVSINRGAACKATEASAIGDRYD